MEAGVFAAGAVDEAAPVRALLRPLFDVFAFVPAACEEESAPPPATDAALLAAIAAVCVAKFIYLSRNRKSSRTDHTCILSREKYWS